MAEAKKKAEPAKEEAKAEVKETPAKKEAAKKAPAKKAPVKKAAAAKKEPAAKETVKEAAAPKKTEEVKAEVKATVNFQFSGKSYTPDDLLNICKDVWKYDLNGKEEDFKSVELYVKPEENTTYYVINGDITGSFFI
ncbi:MAG: hypothetical protein K2P38_18065 [Lachnospiraceae bacterium]|nr:hypothetical protein [Lachnospiraceae bacterium]